MGIGKTINAIGEYDFYSSDYQAFVKSISTFFKINLNVSFFAHMDEGEIKYEKESEFFDIGEKDTCDLTVHYFKFDEEKPLQDNVYCDYELRIPVNLNYEKELLLDFFATGIFQLSFIPLNNTWNFFIEDLIGRNDGYYKSHSEVVREKKAIRDEYIRILSKINCKEAIIWTDAHYETEGKIQNSPSIDAKLSLKDIVKSLEENDKLTLYNFADTVNLKVEIKSSRDSFLDIALYDNFNDKIEITRQ